MSQLPAKRKLTNDQADYLMVCTIAKIKQNFGLTLSHRLLVSTPPGPDMYEWHKALCLQHNIPSLSINDFHALWSKAGLFVYHQQKPKASNWKHHVRQHAVASVYDHKENPGHPEQG